MSPCLRVPVSPRPRVSASPPPPVSCVPAPPCPPQLTLCGADFTQSIGPLTHYYLAIHLQFFLATNGASAAESFLLAILADRNRCLAPLFAAGMPGHLILLVQEYLSVLTFVFFDSARRTPTTPVLLRGLSPTTTQSVLGLPRSS